MPEEPRFLLGHGERLAGPVARPPRGGAAELPYTLAEALDRLAPEIDRTATELSNLPRIACPGNQAVGIITMHPSFTAKSYFPRSLLGSFGLRAVGSRPVTVVPSVSKSEGNERMPTNELYVAGQRDDFEEWARLVRSINPDEPAAVEIRRIEVVRSPDQDDRIRVGSLKQGRERVYEAVLHGFGLQSPRYVAEAFEEYALAIGAEADLARVLYAGGLCYLPITATPQALSRLAQFSFLRVVRPIPRLRVVHPIERSVRAVAGAPCPPPEEDPVDPELVAAVLDGGLAKDSVVSRWSSGIESPDLLQAEPDYVQHGTQVTSATLFGSLVPGEPAPRPFGMVHNHRVLDRESGVIDVELYDVLQRINAILARGTYEFVNLSLGPSGPIEDDEVHTWTAVLDEHLASGNVLATVAVGNDGELDHASGNARIQVPSDAVNALSVGAADSSRAGWARASYSCVGPGRRPGIVKPDVMAFGGCAQEPFFTYLSDAPDPAPTLGTSFASPAALRLAMGVRAHFGRQLGALALKTLLIHTAERHDDGPAQTGWGRCGDDVSSLVVCPEGSVRVVYQGSLVPSQVLRVPIPLPAEELRGDTFVTATICYATKTDPQDPGSYTRAGLDVTFRPHSQRFGRNGTVPKSASFFKRDDYTSENELRSRGHKWETVLHRSQRFRGTSLFQPSFDIHYVPREGGGVAASPDPVRYAIVVTVTNRNDPQIYDQVLREYGTVLEPLQPVVEIPVQIP